MSTFTKFNQYMQYNVSVLQHNSVRRDTRRLEN